MRIYLLAILAIIACTIIAAETAQPSLDANGNIANNLMIERARFMAMQPGFVSIALHRSKDGSHTTAHSSRRDLDTLTAAHQRRRRYVA